MLIRKVIVRSRYCKIKKERKVTK